jgi:hypothetical protein
MQTTRRTTDDPNLLARLVAIRDARGTHHAELAAGLTCGAAIAALLDPRDYLIYPAHPGLQVGVRPSVPDPGAALAAAAAVVDSFPPLRRIETRDDATRWATTGNEFGVVLYDLAEVLR